MQLDLLNVQSLISNYLVTTNTELPNIREKVHSLLLAAGVSAHPCAPSCPPLRKSGYPCPVASAPVLVSCTYWP